MIVYKRDKVFCTNIELGRIPNLNLDVEGGQLQNLLYLPKKANFFKRKIFQMKKNMSEKLSWKLYLQKFSILDVFGGVWNTLLIFTRNTFFYARNVYFRCLAVFWIRMELKHFAPVLLFFKYLVLNIVSYQLNFLKYSHLFVFVFRC